MLLHHKDVSASAGPSPELQTIPPPMDRAHQLPKVMLVDDHYLLLEALTVILKPHYQVACLNSLSNLDAACSAFRPDVLVTDISMPDGDGVSTGQRLARRYPGLKLLFLSMHTEANQILRATGAGGHGFVSKQCRAEELLLAIDTVLNGGSYHSAPLTGVTETKTRSGEELTDRQRQVLKLVARGFSAKEIATELNISVRTAEFHRGAIMQRLNLHSTALLTRYAVETGLI